MRCLEHTPLPSVKYLPQQKATLQCWVSIQGHQLPLNPPDFNGNHTWKEPQYYKSNNCWTKPMISCLFPCSWLKDMFPQLPSVEKRSPGQLGLGILAVRLLRAFKTLIFIFRNLQEGDSWSVTFSTTGSSLSQEHLAEDSTWGAALSPFEGPGLEGRGSSR